MDLKGILFDKDGTLFDFHATWAPWCGRLLDDLSAGDSALAARLARAVGFMPDPPSFAPNSPVIADTPEAIAARLVPLLPGADSAALVARMNALAAQAVPVAVVPLAPLLEGLRARGLVLGVATNDGAAPARAHLAAAGVLDLFDQVIGFDSGFGGKPEPGPLLAFAARAGLAPGQVAMVGDSAHDLTAARAAGMRAVGVGDAPGLAALADVVLADVAALPDWLDRDA